MCMLHLLLTYIIHYPHPTRCRSRPRDKKSRPPLPNQQVELPHTIALPSDRECVLYADCSPPERQGMSPFGKYLLSRIPCRGPMASSATAACSCVFPSGFVGMLIVLAKTCTDVLMMGDGWGTCGTSATPAAGHAMFINYAHLHTRRVMIEHAHVHHAHVMVEHAHVHHAHVMIEHAHVHHNTLYLC